MSPDLLPDAQGRQQLEQLQGQLAARQSILHFAHAAISFVGALILAGASAKLYVDLVDDERLPFAFPVPVAAAGLAVYSLVRYLLGRRRLQVELERFEVLRRLRRSLNVDDPSALLPP